MFYCMRVMAIVALALVALALGATVPAIVNYQGYLTTPTGEPVDADVPATFSLYTVPSGGAPIWSETLTLAVVRGLFQVELGAAATNAFPAGAFDTPLYLGVRIDQDLEMAPRRPLTAAAFAIKADDLDQSQDVLALDTVLTLGVNGQPTALLIVEFHELERGTGTCAKARRRSTLYFRDCTRPSERQSGPSKEHDERSANHPAVEAGGRGGARRHGPGDRAGALRLAPTCGGTYQTALRRGQRAADAAADGIGE